MNGLFFRRFHRFSQIDLAGMLVPDQPRRARSLLKIKAYGNPVTLTLNFLLRSRIGKTLHFSQRVFGTEIATDPQFNRSDRPKISFSSFLF
jgi:hypothetical protein